MTVSIVSCTSIIVELNEILFRGKCDAKMWPKSLNLILWSYESLPALFRGTDPVPRQPSMTAAGNEASMLFNNSKHFPVIGYK